MGFHRRAKGVGPGGGLMGLGGEFAQGAGAVTMEGLPIGGSDAEIHDHPARADTLNGVMDGQVIRLADRFAETRFESMHHHVDILVPFGVEIGNPEEFLKEGLLRPLEMEEITRVMEHPEGVEFIKENRGGMSIDLGHVKGTAERRRTYDLRVKMFRPA